MTSEKLSDIDRFEALDPITQEMVRKIAEDEMMTIGKAMEVLRERSKGQISDQAIQRGIDHAR